MSKPSSVNKNAASKEAIEAAGQLAQELERQGIVTFHVGNVQRIALEFIQSAIDKATEPLFTLLQWSYDEHMHFGWGYEELHDKIIEILGDKLKPQIEVIKPAAQPQRGNPSGFRGDKFKPSWRTPASGAASSEPQEQWTGLRILNRINEVGESNLADELNAALAAERQKREQAEQELHDLTCLLEGNCYSDPDFIKDSRALKAAVELRAQLLQAQAAIEKHNKKCMWEGAGQIEIDPSALREHVKQYEGAAHHMEACRELLGVPEDEVLYGAIEELRDSRKPLVEALGRLHYGKDGAPIAWPSEADVVAALAQVKSRKATPRDKELLKTEKGNEGNNGSIT